MFSRIFLACLSLSLFGAGCSLSCGWMKDKFKQYSGDYLGLLDQMANNSNVTRDTEGQFMELDFPNSTSKESTEVKLALAVRILRRTADLFEEDYSSASWEEKTVDDFVGVVTEQAEGLHSCMGRRSHKTSKKLDMYSKKLDKCFKKMLTHLQKMGHSAEAWELIREEIKFHLKRTDLLFPSPNTN